MELEGVHYVFAAFAATFLILLVWMWMIGAKVRRLDDQAQQHPGASTAQATDGGARSDA